jgi:hypothetical protein
MCCFALRGNHTHLRSFISARAKCGQRMGLSLRTKRGKCLAGRTLVLTASSHSHSRPSDSSWPCNMHLALMPPQLSTCLRSTRWPRPQVSDGATLLQQTGLVFGTPDVPGNYDTSHLAVSFLRSLFLILVFHFHSVCLCKSPLPALTLVAFMDAVPFTTILSVWLCARGKRDFCSRLSQNECQPRQHAITFNTYTHQTYTDTDLTHALEPPVTRPNSASVTATFAGTTGERVYGLGEHRTGVVNQMPYTKRFADSQDYGKSQGSDVSIPWYE